MYKPKTTETSASVQKFLDAVADETKRADSWRLVEIMTKATGAQPKMWGPTIVGFGNHHYKYESGHEATPACSASRRARPRSRST